MRMTHRNPRRGITSALAMMYLALFSTLALGFYASVTTAVQVSSNEQQTGRALMAAESGMAFIKYHLANLGIPAGTTQDQLFDQVYARLKTRLEGHVTMQVLLPDNTTTPGLVTKDAGNTTITIPHIYGIRSDNAGSTFVVTITKAQGGQQLKVKVAGNFKTARSARAAKLDYSIAKDAAKIFDY